ncbi:hypothetical protein E2562_010578 [Oryza meyeriana var. granulata]|uniref:Uncharacterized protein n=1 Tax=Oryza meyeriana var. granulata TaxID=110450 RepID=A0A6G1BV28_9ORYZ|nr:hypothetical protein E2562_010578 [Oryza meyeriana var. granulata]
MVLSWQHGGEATGCGARGSPRLRPCGALSGGTRWGRYMGCWWRILKKGQQGRRSWRVVACAEVRVGVSERQRPPNLEELVWCRHDNEVLEIGWATAPILPSQPCYWGYRG